MKIKLEVVKLEKAIDGNHLVEVVARTSPDAYCTAELRIQVSMDDVWNLRFGDELEITI